MQKTKINNKIHYGSRTVDVLLGIIVACLCILFIYPFLNVLAVSLSSNSMITTGQVTFFPKEINMEGYRVLFQEQNIFKAYGNTIMIALATTIVSLVLTSMLAYVMMLPEFALKKPFSILLLITMFFNGGTVPTYILIQNMGLYDTWWALILPNAVTAYNVFVYRAFFKGISPEIREATKIDGASDIKILAMIYAPLSKALYATFGLFTFVNTWNDYYNALLYIKDADKHPIQMILRKIVFTSGVQAMGGAQDMIANNKLNTLNVQYACVIATMLPVLIIYPFVQKYFAQGMQVGAVKG